MVEGDLGPLGRRDSRGGGCLFLWGSVNLRLACRKVAQGFSLCCTYGFPRADPVRRYSDRGYVADVSLSVFGVFGWICLDACWATT